MLLVLGLDVYFRENHPIAFTIKALLDKILGLLRTRRR